MSSSSVWGEMSDLPANRAKNEKRETRQLKKQIMTCFKAAFISLLKFLIFVISGNSKCTTVVL